MHIEYTVQFRICGDFEPELLSVELDLIPKMIVKSGQIILGTRTTKSVWSFAELVDDEIIHWSNLEDGLNSLLNKLSQKQEKIKQLQSKYSVDLFCGMFSSSFDGGPAFSPKLFKRLAEFGVELFIDCYL